MRPEGGAASGASGTEEVGQSAPRAKLGARTGNLTKGAPIMATTSDVQNALLEAILRAAPNANPLALLCLAEALAWLQHPDQGHAGTRAPAG